MACAHLALTAVEDTQMGIILWIERRQRFLDHLLEGGAMLEDGLLKWHFKTIPGLLNRGARLETAHQSQPPDGPLYHRALSAHLLLAGEWDVNVLRRADLH